MISESCDIKEFLDAAKNKDISELILLADREALEAWRMSRRHRKRSGKGMGDCGRYEILLKEFTRYLRSANSLPKKSDDPLYSTLHQFHEKHLSSKNSRA